MVVWLQYKSELRVLKGEEHGEDCICKLQSIRAEQYPAGDPLEKSMLFQDEGFEKNVRGETDVERRGGGCRVRVQQKSGHRKGGLGVTGNWRGKSKAADRKMKSGMYLV